MIFVIRLCTIAGLTATLLGGTLISKSAAATFWTIFEHSFRLEISPAKPPIAFQNFIDEVINGDGQAVVGIYIPGILALPVEQQPDGNDIYVTRDPEQATQFRIAAQYGTVGILAHNHLAGAQFSEIQLNQYAAVVYGDGHFGCYRVQEIQKYQALSPNSAFSDFINLDRQEKELSSGELFDRVYSPGGRLVLQTCITAAGDPSWGRMFIIAVPATGDENFCSEMDALHPFHYKN